MRLRVLRGAVWRLRLLRRVVRRARLISRLRWAALLAGAPIEVEIARRVELGPRLEVRVRGPRPVRVRIAEGSSLGSGVLLRLSGGAVEIGPRTTVRRGATLTTNGGHITFDGETLVGWYTSVHSSTNVHIGPCVTIAEHVVVVDSTHVHEDPMTPVYHQEVGGEVEIGANAFIGAGAVVARNARIGDSAFVGANAVVSGHVATGARIVASAGSNGPVQD